MTGVENPLLLDFPDQFETERLIICAPKIGDGQMINQAITESYAELKPWMPWAYTIPTVERSEELNRIAVSQYLRRESMRMNVLQKSDGLFVGVTSLHHINWSVPSFEVGYWLRTSAVGKGYASESVDGIVDFAFGLFGAQRVEIRCDPRNDRSAAVAIRAGFMKEGHIRHDQREKDDTLSDAYVFGMLRSEWESLPRNTTHQK